MTVNAFAPNVNRNMKGRSMAFSDSSLNQFADIYLSVIIIGTLPDRVYVKITTLFLTFSLLLFRVAAFAEEGPDLYRMDWKKFNMVEDVDEIVQLAALGIRKETIVQLADAKYALINGNIVKATEILNDIDEYDNSLKKIKTYYKSIISFIDGNFKESLQYQTQYPTTAEQLEQVCLFKTMTYIFLSMQHKDKIKEEIDSCLYLNFGNAANNFTWLSSYLNYTSKDGDKDSTEKKQQLYKILSYLRHDNSDIRLWLKMALYFEDPAKTVEYIPELPKETFYSSSARELIGLLYHRLGQNDKAFSFVEDLDSANAQNIKGNIRLANKDYESAYGNFTLALKARRTSKNALERMIPVAWKLKIWDDGIKLLNSPLIRDRPFFDRILMKSAFYLRNGDTKAAGSELHYLLQNYKDKTPYLFNILYNQYALQTGDTKALAEYSDLVCRKFDGNHCWIKMQSLIWPNLGRTASRDEPIFDDKGLTLDSLKTPYDGKKIEEPTFVDQRDIEEMDEAVILKRLR